MSDPRIWSGGYEGRELALPDESIYDAFTARAAEAPDRPALEYEEVVLSYGELNTRANRLAAHLIDRGVEPGAFVGVHLPRCIEMVVAVLAVGKAGAAYVMLDPDYPRDRLRGSIEDAGIGLVVTDRATGGASPWPDADRLLVDAEADRIAAYPGHDVSVRVDPASPACVMFTSGSTGRAKGAVASHRALTSWFQSPAFLDCFPAPAWLQHSPVSWDVFAMELFGALLFGGRCVLQPGQKPEPAAIARLVPDRGVDTLWLSSGLFAVMMDEYPDTFASVRQVIFGGEPPSQSHVLAAHARFPHVRLVNAYGGVETSLVETFHVVGDLDHARTTLPIGHPESNTRAHLLDDRLREAESGSAGEIYIAGPGIVDGYVGRPDLTATRFVADPLGAPGGRMYRTGDLVRYQDDATLTLIGRADDQVKVRGFRVEPGEIEAALSAHEAVDRVVVSVRSMPSGAKQIVAYVVPNRETAEPELLDYARELLPEHAVPDAVVLIGTLPLTVNGKIDRAALPAPSPRDTPSTGARPEDKRVRILRELFSATLNVPDVGADDNFFTLGGDSLTAVRLVNRIRTAFSSEIDHATLFDAPTAAQLAPLLADRPTERPALRRRRRDSF